MKLNRVTRWLALLGAVLLAGTAAGCQKQAAAAPVAQKLTAPKAAPATVHDPSIVQTNGRYYIIGSHMQFASSKNLIQWQQLSTSVKDTKLFSNITAELGPALSDAETDTFWAGDIEQLKDGKYYMYYCACQGSSPTSVLGVAVADKVTGPYKDQGIILRSGGAIKDDAAYDATQQPNVVDPHVFHDQTGQLWMVYGSYSGGIFILKMNEETGKPYPGQGYGQRLLGGNHVRIEGAYMLYNNQTDYYYLFLSFGGLSADGGYNLRVFRSRQPNGGFVDAQGQQAADIRGKLGTTFDDAAIQDYGNKLIGNFTWKEGSKQGGYVSPGHNTAFQDKQTGKYFVMFHTRFPGRGEYYEDRVHQMFFTRDGWPVLNPAPYDQETKTNYTTKQVIGDYQIVQMNKLITEDPATAKTTTVDQDGKLTGKVTGSWTNKNGQATLKTNQTTYSGVFISSWDPYQKAQTMMFSGTDAQGEPVFMRRMVTR